jgi:hypothetical protein
VTGVTGASGARGEAGASGPAGKEGAPGPTGKEGIAGKEGTPGAEGREGKEGKEGKAGGNGANGATGATGASAAADIAVEYATASGTGKSVTASCPAGDVAIGGGGSNPSGEDSYSTSGPVNSTTKTPPTSGSGAYSAAPTGWLYSSAAKGPVTAYALCSK